MYLPTFYLFKAVFFGDCGLMSCWRLVGHLYRENFENDLPALKCWGPPTSSASPCRFYLRIPIRHVVELGWTIYFSIVQSKSRRRALGLALSEVNLVLGRPNQTFVRLASNGRCAGKGPSGTIRSSGRRPAAASSSSTWQRRVPLRVPGTLARPRAKNRLAAADIDRLCPRERVLVKAARRSDPRPRRANADRRFFGLGIASRPS